MIRPWSLISMMTSTVGWGFRQWRLFFWEPIETILGERPPRDKGGGWPTGVLKRGQKSGRLRIFPPDGGWHGPCRRPIMDSRARSRAMTKKKLTLFFGAGMLLAAWAAGQASDHYQVINRPKDFYFGHISLVEIKNDGQDPVVLREGAAKPELAVLNTPIGPGDTVQTAGRRVEIQLDNGTILRLDSNSELKVETILAQSLSSGQKLTNLVLRRGQLYAMYKQFSARETFQVLTTTAAVKLTMDTVAMVERAEDGTTSVQVKRGRADVLYGPTKDNLKAQKVGRAERVTIAPDHRFALQGYLAGSDFERWNEQINADFVDLHEGLTPLPKPVQRLPRAIVYWAQRWGNQYGEWVWDDFLGYLWRPFYNDRYPSGSWVPYYHGQWTRVGGQMFWVPNEPWGWVPYHLGVWHWSP
ncbi:MAG: FecR domain-containing protein, partial [Candidatus Aminicenantes bacterium]|nr:FecR domain-containing protein [Candidatus Aminicenantes bacterium]